MRWRRNGTHENRKALSERDRDDRHGEAHGSAAGDRPLEAVGDREVRRDDRGRHAPGCRSEARRAAGSRHRRPPARHRQEGPRAGSDQRGQGARGPRGRRGLRRLGRVDQEAQRGLAGRGQHHRDAGHDGRGRQAGTRSGTTGPHAESEKRNGDDGHRQGRARGEVRKDRIPRRQGGKPACARGEGILREGAAPRKRRDVPSRG